MPRRSPRSARDSYTAAVRFIAQLSPNAVETHPAMLLLADMYESDANSVARDVARERNSPRAKWDTYNLPPRRPRAPQAPKPEPTKPTLCPECEGVAADECSEQGVTWQLCDECKAGISKEAVIYVTVPL